MKQFDHELLCGQIYRRPLRSRDTILSDFLRCCRRNSGIVSQDRTTTVAFLARTFESQFIFRETGAGRTVQNIKYRTLKNF